MNIPPAAIVFAWMLCGANAAIAQGSVDPRAASPALPIPRAEFLVTMDKEFQKMDADGNEAVTRKEVETYERAAAAKVAEARLRALFNALDVDKNGSLSHAEFNGLPIETPASTQSVVLTQTDLNRDGSISLVEYRTAKLANFDRLDTDKDGVVSIAEMKAAGLAR